GGQIISYSTHHRIHFLHLEPTRNKQPALFDVRVRKALASGMDRATIADVVSEGTTQLSEILMGPNDPLYPRVQQTISKYPFDRARAFGLLEEAGWVRRGDALINPASRVFTLGVY